MRWLRQRVTWALLCTAATTSGCECRPEMVAPGPIPSSPPKRTATPTASSTATNAPPSPKRDATWEARLDEVRLALVALHQPKRAPQPGDWLHDHKERGQTYAAYRRSRPVTPDRVGEGPRRLLYVQPLGELGPAHADVVKTTTAYLSIFFGLEVRTQPPLPLALIPDKAQRKRHGRRQLLSAFILDKLLAPRLPTDAAAYISFTSEDLWPGEGWNFVFGEASLEDRVGVWSMQRYGDPHAGAKSQHRILARTLRVAAHETGHMFSLRHCTAYECIMNGSNNLAESDRAPMWLCPECLAKVLWATHQDPATRFERLAQFAQEHGLSREAAFFQRSASAVRLP